MVLEAQWLGLPVVLTDAGGVRESFEHGVTGLLATNPTAEDIGTLVIRYLTDQAMRAKSERHGPTFVENKFGVNRMVQETLALYGFPSTQETMNPVMSEKLTETVQA